LPDAGGLWWVEANWQRGTNRAGRLRKTCADARHQLAAGFDEFVAPARQRAANLVLPPPEPDFERLWAIADEHGIDILGPPGELP
jgi:hypothetical protein